MPAPAKASGGPAISPRSVTSASTATARKTKRPGSASSAKSESSQPKRQPFALRTADLAFDDANLMRT